MNMTVSCLNIGKHKKKFSWSYTPSGGVQGVFALVSGFFFSKKRSFGNLKVFIYQPPIKKGKNGLRTKESYGSEL
jgi:hypothetical protein